MKGLIWRLGPAWLVCGLVVALAACGSESNSSSINSSDRSSMRLANDGSAQSLTNGKQGGTLTVYDHEDFLHLDPGQAYFSLDYQVIYATQRTLFQFPPNDPKHAVPDLAAEPAQVSADGRTITVHIRRGVHYSPPVNREVTSDDVAYAIERGANPNVANPYFPAYFGYIVGASHATGGPISGISTPDRYTIVLHLTGSYGTFLVGALSMPLTAPVPKEFAAPLDRKTPTQYGVVYEVATGPYMLKANSEGRFLGSGYHPGWSATLVRNPNWKASTDFRPAYLDQVNIKIGGDPDVIGRQVLMGSHSVQNDNPSGSIVKLAYQHYFSQLFAVPGTGVSYMAVNNKTGPFSNVSIRRALWATLDRRGIVRVSGGDVTGQVGTHFVYPGSIGYDQSGGDRGPNVDYNNYPSGNITVAAKYMKQAGYPTGRYTGSAVVKVVGAIGAPGDKIAAIANRAIQSLGFKTHFTLLDQSAMYGKYCGVPKQEVDACPNVGWIRDWADPQTLLAPTFAGYNIVETNNPNWGQVSWQDWPKSNGGTYTGGPLTTLDQAMKNAETTVGDAARAQAWAHVDDTLTSEAVAIPFYFPKQPAIESHDVRGIVQLWNQASFDYNFTSLR
jgi:peptide/nickel transport system substrate-binding protein